MAEFPYYQRSVPDRGSQLVSQIVEQRMQMQRLIAEQQQADERMKTQMLLGVSSSELPTYAPELVADLGKSATPRELAENLARVSQVAQARKLLHGDYQQKAQAIQTAAATPGGDISGAVQSSMATLTQPDSSGATLPPNVIESILRANEVAVQSGLAKRQETTEQRDFSEQTYQNRFAQQEGAEMAREGRIEARALEREKRAREENDRIFNRNLAVRAGVEYYDGMSLAEIQSADAYKRATGKAQSKEVAAANAAVNKTAQRMNRELEKGKIDDLGSEEFLGRIAEANTQSATTGADIVLMPHSVDGFWTKDSVRIRPMTSAQARREMGQLYQAAIDAGDAPGQPPESPEGKMFETLYNLAQTSGNPSFASLFTTQLTDEQRAQVEREQQAAVAPPEETSPVQGPGQKRRAPRGSAQPYEIVPPEEVRPRIVRRAPGETSTRGAPQRGGR